MYLCQRSARAARCLQSRPSTCKGQSKVHATMERQGSVRWRASRFRARSKPTPHRGFATLEHPSPASGHVIIQQEPRFGSLSAASPDRCASDDKPAARVHPNVTQHTHNKLSGWLGWANKNNGTRGNSWDVKGCRIADGQRGERKRRDPSALHLPVAQVAISKTLCLHYS
ncbi:hypothetical protein B0T17DRAFT_508712 [Bombardia bombarda]|uniref:Uncharacterized protein n=1 Tax=Bombardia bombarda TaxID=252184 RepID=A0AA39WTU8_9PEZI|nr:hypothetical protein B0T17DRAFT_508712 [Bombardia bombarda]